jgi:predicted transcriptional regulator
MFDVMKTLAVELPDGLAAALDIAAVESGCDAQELARAALREFIEHGRFALQERHQLEDITAALREAGLER